MSLAGLNSDNINILWGETLYVENIDSIDFNLGIQPDVNIGLVKAANVRVAGAGIPLYLNGVLYNPLVGSGYTTDTPTAATDANGIIVDNTTGQINLEIADATHAGITTTAAQTFAGNKTFNNDIIVNGTTKTDYIEPASASPTLNIATTTATSINIGREANVLTSVVTDRFSVDKGVIDTTGGRPLLLGTTFATGVKVGNTYSYAGDATRRIATINSDGRLAGNASALNFNNVPVTNWSGSVTSTGAGQSLLYGGGPALGANTYIKSIEAGSGITVTDVFGSQLRIDSTVSGTTLTGTGSATSLVYNGTSPTFQTKDLSAGANISLTDNGTYVTIEGKPVVAVSGCTITDFGTYWGLSVP